MTRPVERAELGFCRVSRLPFAAAVSLARDAAEDQHDFDAMMTQEVMHMPADEPQRLFSAPPRPNFARSPRRLRRLSRRHTAISRRRRAGRCCGIDNTTRTAGVIGRRRVAAAGEMPSRWRRHSPRSPLLPARTRQPPDVESPKSLAEAPRLPGRPRHATRVIIGSIAMRFDGLSTPGRPRRRASGNTLSPAIPLPRLTPANAPSAETLKHHAGADIYRCAAAIMPRYAMSQSRAGRANMPAPLSPSSHAR